MIYDSFLKRIMRMAFGGSPSLVYELPHILLFFWTLPNYLVSFPLLSCSILATWTWAGAALLLGDSFWSSFAWKILVVQIPVLVMLFLHWAWNPVPIEVKIIQRFGLDPSRRVPGFLRRATALVSGSLHHSYKNHLDVKLGSAVTIREHEAREDGLPFDRERENNDPLGALMTSFDSFSTIGRHYSYHSTIVLVAAVVSAITLGFAGIYWSLEISLGDQFRDLNGAADAVLYSLSTLATFDLGASSPASGLARATVALEVTCSWIILVVSLFVVALRTPQSFEMARFSLERYADRVRQRVEREWKEEWRRKRASQ